MRVIKSPTMANPITTRYRAKNPSPERVINRSNRRAATAPVIADTIVAVTRIPRSVPVGCVWIKSFPVQGV